MIVTENEMKDYLFEYYEKLFIQNRKTDISNENKVKIMAQMETVETLMFYIFGGKTCLQLYNELDKKY